MNTVDTNTDLIEKPSKDKRPILLICDSMYRSIRSEYLATVDPLQRIFDKNDFFAYVEKIYGIRMRGFLQGHRSYDVVDEKMYVFFLLKWDVNEN